MIEPLTTGIDTISEDDALRLVNTKDRRDNFTFSGDRALTFREEITISNRNKT